jgi:hypothetical protein
VFEKRLWLVKLSFRDDRQRELGTSEFSVMARTHWGAQREVRRQVEIMRHSYGQMYPGQSVSIYSTVSLGVGEFICVA